MSRPRLSLRRPRDDRGSEMLQFVAFFPLLLTIVVIVFETFTVFVALERMESAARTGARVASQNEDTMAAAAAGNEALPAWLRDRGATVSVIQDGRGGYYGETSATVPLLFQNIGLEFTLTRRVDMPRA